MIDTNIIRIRAREILDSRGNPTLEVDVELECGSLGRAAVPSGASTGTHEALELRDGDTLRYRGKGTLTAVSHVNNTINDVLRGKDALNQALLDETMIRLDGTPDKSRLGANAILGVSMAAARAGALALSIPLFNHLGGSLSCTLPVPLMNIMNGGVHAHWEGSDFQEYMIVPYGAPTFQDALRWGSEVYHTLEAILEKRGYSTGIGDEGGFAPKVSSNEEPLDLISTAIDEAGYAPGKEIGLAIDAASSELYREGSYFLKIEDKRLSSEDLVETYERLSRSYPLVVLEDGLAQDDWAGWKKLRARLGDRVDLVGDDLFTTSVKRIRRGIEEHAATSVLIKPNQIGTVTETIAAARLAQKAGWGIVVSHRSGETADPFIADLAVALGAGRLKAGAPCRGERVAKYNRLLRIEEKLGDTAIFAGRGAFVMRTPNRIETEENA